MNRRQTAKAILAEDRDFGCYYVHSRYMGQDKPAKMSWWNVQCRECETHKVVSSTALRRTPTYCGSCTIKPRNYPLKAMTCAVCGKEGSVDSRRYVYYCSKLCQRGASSDRYNANRRASLLGTLKYMLIHVRSRSKRKGLPFDLDMEWLKEELVKNNFCCARSNLPLTPSREDKAGKRGIYPTTISLDKVDPTKGYTKDNVEVVCYLYNISKNKFTTEDVIEMAKGVLEKSGYLVLRKEGRSQ